VCDKRIEDRRKKVIQKGMKRESWTVREAEAQSDSDATQPCCQQNSSIIPEEQRQ